MPWFEELPLNWTNPHTRRAEQLLLKVYRRTHELLDLADNAGVDITRLNQSLPPRTMIRRIMEKARSSNHFDRLLAEVLADEEREAIWVELASLLSGHEATIRAARFADYPTLASMSIGTSGLYVQGAGTGAAKPLSGQLEKIINHAAGFADVAVFGRHLAEAEVRIGRFEIGGHVTGTGFLVGERLLLTNWHVVQGLEGQADPAALGRVRFDVKVGADGSPASEGRMVAIASDWNAASSPHASISDELSADGPPPGAFDFALVRLAEPIGSESLGAATAGAGDTRGWYKLDGGQYLFHEQEPLHIIGHPCALPMQLSYASPAQCKLSKHENRIRYTTNTAGGSSGSPVFNKDWRIVALHNGSGPTETGGPLDQKHADFNQGIPMHLIVRELNKQLDGKPEATELGLL